MKTRARRSRKKHKKNYLKLGSIIVGFLLITLGALAGIMITKSTSISIGPGPETETFQNQGPILQHEILEDSLKNALKEAEAEKVQEEPLREKSDQMSVVSSEALTDMDRMAQTEAISLANTMKYSEYSEISSGNAFLYRNNETNRNGYTICVNAGHGTKGGESVKTLCHPDGTPKVTGGTTAAGQTKAAAISSGMTFLDGTPEREVTLKQALVLKDLLLKKGYSVLMIRETEDVQLDNVARTVLANAYADCHIALHWDSSETDKGAFYMSVPESADYRKMEPVASTWEKSHRLGESLIKGLRDSGVNIFSSGSMAMDLTQTSYSTVASIDVELGDKKTDHTDQRLLMNAEGLVKGIELYFQE